MSLIRLAPLFAAFAILVATVQAGCAEDRAIDISFENHRFSPQMIAVPAGLPLVVRVTNSSKETIEFESFKLNREKVVEPGQRIVVHLPALSPGDYDFYDDFHQDVPQGSIVAQ